MTHPAPLPPEAPLAMPMQRFHGNPPGTIEVRTAPPGLLAKRLLLIVATAVLGMYASTGLRIAPGEDGIGVLDVVLLALFVPLMSWIAFGFVSGLVGFVKLYLPVFLLGAVFGKVIELSGFSESIVAAAIKYIGRTRANAVIVAVCALLTYGGVSLFVVVFAVYPFAAELYRQSNIPKRLMPGAIALGAFSFTMDSLPGTPQIQNIIPTTFFKTTAWAAPVLGVAGAVFIVVVGLTYLEWRRRAAAANGEGYGASLLNEPERVNSDNLPNPVLAITPLILGGVVNYALTKAIPHWYGGQFDVTPDILPGLHAPVSISINGVVAIWAVEGALLTGILLAIVGGVVHLAGGIVRVRRDHRFLVRAAAAAFDAYLYRSGRSHSQAA